MTNDKGFNYDAYWNRIGQPTTGKKKLADIRYPLLHIMHKILVGPFMHRSGSKDKVQKPNLLLLSLLDEGKNANVAWILAEYLSKKAPSIKEKRKFIEVFSSWIAFGGNTRDLGSFEKETDKITDVHQIHEEVLFIERGDGVVGIKQRRRDLSSDDVRDLVTASGRGRLKEDPESST
ncbi:hypothetical protein Tco_0168110 [Tanacetum coccineum]